MLLASLKVRGRAPLTGYSRAQFGSAWTDDNDDPLGHNGCDTRNDILRRDLTAVTLKFGTHGCTVLTGLLNDSYTGARIAFRRGVSTSTAVQIDHVVALGDAWQTGAQSLSMQTRIDLANDPIELLAVDGPTNEAKGDGDAATWLPPNKSTRCGYVARQVAVKARYALWVTAAEHDAIVRVLSACPGQRPPTESGAVARSPINAGTVQSAADGVAESTPALPVAPTVPLSATSPAVGTARAGAGLPSAGTVQPAPTGATAVCRDGTYSYAKHHSGACSRHGGVARFND